jgi:hypothetical protein
MIVAVRLWSLLASLCVSSVVVAAQTPQYEKQGKPCAGLQGNARTTCLREELRRANAEVAAANANLARLDRRMTAACNTVAFLDQAAQAAELAGDVTQAKPLSFGGQTWTSVRALMTQLTREKKNCADARRAVEEARRRT